MSDPLKNVRAVVVVLAMPECPACVEYKPRFEKMVDHFAAHGVPLVWYANGGTVTKGTIPVMMIDATSQDPGVQQFCDLHAVEAMPTTLLLTQRAQPYRVQGAISDDEIYQLLSAAAQANR